MTRSVANPIILADAGIETELIERYEQELPEFAAFILLDTEDGRRALTDYYREYLDLATRRTLPIVVDTPTWRASKDWGQVLGYDASALARVNARNVAFVRSLAHEYAPGHDVTVNGCVGPRFDEYDEAQRMTAEEARDYHLVQVQTLAAAGADRVTSVTTLDANEGIGVVLAAQSVGLPAAVSFTVQEDGLLADGSDISRAIASVDAATSGAAVGFLVNCAHPEAVLKSISRASDHDVLGRLFGVRLNAAHEGDDTRGDTPEQFAAAIARLASKLPSLRVFGGCCGTNSTHVSAVADALESR